MDTQNKRWKIPYIIFLLLVGFIPVFFFILELQYVDEPSYPPYETSNLPFSFLIPFGVAILLSFALYAWNLDFAWVSLFFSIPGVIAFYTLFISPGRHNLELLTGAVIAIGIIPYLALLIPTWLFLRKSNKKRLAFGIKIFFDLLALALTIPFLDFRGGIIWAQFLIYIALFGVLWLGWHLIIKRFRSFESQPQN